MLLNYKMEKNDSIKQKYDSNIDKIPSINNSYMEPWDENDSFIDRNILKSDRFKNIKKKKFK